MKITDDNFGVSRPYASWCSSLVNDETGYFWVRGTVYTKRGAITVDLGSGKRLTGNRYAYTVLRFAHAGRVWQRTFDRCYSRRYAVTLANNFAREIAEGVET